MTIITLPSPELEVSIYGNITKPWGNDPTNRWLEGVTNEQHHAHYALTSSKIKEWGSVSKEYWYKKNVLRSVKEKITAERRKTFLTGTLFHMLALETERFEKTVSVCDLAGNTNDYKDFVNEKFGVKPKGRQLINETGLPEITVPKKITKTELAKLEREERKSYEVTRTKDGGFLKDGEEYFLVSTEEMEQLRAMHKSLNSHKRAGLLIDQSVSEISGIAQCPLTGLFMMIRGDSRCKERGFFADIKTSDAQSFTPDNVRTTIENLGYGIPAVHYMDVGNLIDGANTYKNFFFIFVSKQEPYEVYVTSLMKNDVELHKKIRMNKLLEIKEAETNGTWERCDGKTYGNQTSLSDWYYRKHGL